MIRTLNTEVTFTVLEVVDVFPDKSVDEYVITYVPRTEVSTVPVAMTVVVPSTRSNAVAPGSVNSVPIVKDIVEEPFKVMTGAVVSFITTSELVVEKLPEESVAVQITVVVPSAKLDGA